jgi:membrane protein
MADAVRPVAREHKGLRGRLRAYGDRWPLLGRTLDVHERFGEVGGSRLAGSLAFQAFLSLFPLMLVVAAAVGFFSARSATDVPARIVAELGLRGETATTMVTAVRAAEDSRRVASVVGLAGLLWSGLGLVGAFQFAFNRVWGVESQSGMRPRALGLAWLAGAGLLFVVAAGVAAALNFLPALLAPVGVVVGLGVNFTLWIWTTRLLPNRDVGWRPLVPGAIVGAIGLEALKIGGAVYIPRLVESSSQLYGSIGVIFALLAWLLLFSRLVVYAEALNAVLYQRRPEPKGQAPDRALQTA